MKFVPPRWPAHPNKPIQFFLFVAVLMGSLTASAALLPLGTRWALERNNHGRAISIFDLSFPGFATRVALSETPPLEQWSTAQNNKTLATTSTDWWRQIPWKDERLTTFQNEPSRFLLSDIDFLRIATSPRRFARYSKAVEKRHPHFFEQIEFIRNPDGHYTIYWNPSPLDVKAASLYSIANLRKPKAQLTEAIARELIRAGLYTAVSFIPVPLVGALFGTALDRFFRYEDLLIYSHQDAFLEMMEDSLPELTPNEKGRAVTSILYFQSSLLDIPQWIWKKPISTWRKALKIQKTATILTRRWLQKQGEPYSTLSEHFDWTSSWDAPSPGRIYLSSYLRFGVSSFSEPKWAWDASKPHWIYGTRVALEIESAGVIFAAAWIPYVGMAATETYKTLVERPDDHARRWEARLIARLESLQNESHQDWEPILEILQRQATNPFEISRTRAKELIEKRRQTVLP
ncbi:hypothetical protein WDW37_10740 [Bdellovibrionota bacterium FG-1]